MHVDRSNLQARLVGVPRNGDRRSRRRVPSRLAFDLQLEQNRSHYLPLPFFFFFGFV